MAIHLIQSSDDANATDYKQARAGRVIRYAEKTPIRDENDDRGIRWPSSRGFGRRA